MPSNNNVCGRAQYDPKKNKRYGNAKNIHIFSSIKLFININKAYVEIEFLIAVVMKSFGRLLPVSRWFLAWLILRP
jgi:hypothetical protein